LYDGNLNYGFHKPLQFLFNLYDNFRLKVKRILIVAKLEYKVCPILIMHSEA